jgi:hypothetical protein
LFPGDVEVLLLELDDLEEVLVGVAELLELEEELLVDEDELELELELGAVTPASASWTSAVASAPSPVTYFVTKVVFCAVLSRT